MRPPQQTRSRRTLDRISRAALDLMEEVGPEGATVAAIVERAGTSVGSFYARFPGKEELVRYLQERAWSEARERWEEAMDGEDWDGLPLETVVQRAVGLLIAASRNDVRRQRLLGRAQTGEGDATRLAATFRAHLLESILPLFLARRTEIRHPDPVRAITLGYRMVMGAMRETMELEQPGADRPVGAEMGPDPLGDLNVELSRAWTAYLSLGQAPEVPPGPGVVDFFDPWGG